MTALDPQIRAAIVAACGFEPAAVTAFGVLTVEAAFAPGRASVLVPVRRGMAKATYLDPMLSAHLNAGVCVVVAFKRQKDADLFERLLAAERARTKTPLVTHVAPMVLQ